MIIISLGNPGSGKTASIVREMILNPTHRKTYCNIVPKKDIPHIKTIEQEMIVKKEITGYKKKRSGGEEAIIKKSLNVEFWQEINEPINVVIDEAHTILNARRSMSKNNVILSDWLALIRRVLGSGDAGHGQLVLISQLHNRIDSIARDMATQIRYHVCHYLKTCKNCKFTFSETSEYPEPAFSCYNCKSPKLKKHSHRIEVWNFSHIDKYVEWKEFKVKSYYRHYFINDIEEYFPFYDTLQWDNLISEVD